MKTLMTFKPKHKKGYSSKRDAFKSRKLMDCPKIFILMMFSFLKGYWLNNCVYKCFYHS